MLHSYYYDFFFKYYYYIFCVKSLPHLFIILVSLGKRMVEESCSSWVGGVLLLMLY